MKDQFTTVRSDVIQHQVELQAGFAELIHHAQQCGDPHRARTLQDQLESFNARVTALANALGDRWPSQPDCRVTPV